MVTKGLILSCDWGTTSFRLRMVDMEHQRVIGTLSSAEGTAAAHRRWQRQGTAQDRESFYRSILLNNTQKLLKRLRIAFGPIPVVISGMATSSIGMRELPYAPLPFSVDGRDAVARWLERGPDFPAGILLISGAGGQADVMRGEETQMIGLACLQEPGRSVPDSVYVFPGTHSKHLRVEGGKVTDLRTYMTGELFELMATRSILRHAVSASRATEPDAAATRAFRSGVRRAASDDLLHALFSIRVNQLFGKGSPEERYFYLSGLLIGTELKSSGTERVTLCSGSRVYGLYRTALEELGRPAQIEAISPEMMDEALVRAHIHLYRQHNAPVNNASA